VRFALALVYLVACSSHRDPVAPPGEHFCREIDPAAPLRLVRTRTTTVIYGDQAGCPAESAKCKRGELAPNDEAIVAREEAGFACVWYPAGGGHTGWVSARALVTVASERAPAWPGRWTAADNEIVITPAAEGLQARGHAVWHGYGDNVHEGNFAGVVTPGASGVATVEDSACSVRMQRVGRYLVAGDNNECGGVNVRFDGVYSTQP